MLIEERTINDAYHTWSWERLSPSGGPVTASKEVNKSLWRTGLILPFMFGAINSLYMVARRIPSPWSSSEGMGVRSGATESIYFSIPLYTELYQLLRTVLSLSGDVSNCAKSILHTGEIFELRRLIIVLDDKLGEIREARNFFTHLDEVLSKPEKHGISYPTQTSCGIVDTDTAKRNVHCILALDKLHFSYKREACVADIGKATFNDIFGCARQIYREITDFKLPFHKETRTFPPADIFYPPL